MTNDSELDPTIRAFVEGHNSRDWDALRSLLVQDFIFVDHRPPGIATGSGIDDYLTLLKSGVELVPDRRITDTQTHAPGAVFFRADGTDEYGNAVEWEFIVVWRLRGGQIERLEFFLPNSVDEAMERARALSSGAVT